MPIENSFSDSNLLPDGLTLQQVEHAIEKSGYPLQIDVASELQRAFDLQPEWGFVDRNTQATRALDLMATRDLSHRGVSPAQRVRPHVVLLIECKKSELPYVFFGSDAPAPDTFPHVAGLNHEGIVVKTDDDPSSWQMPFFMALGLNDQPFLRSVPAISTNLSKVVRKSRDVELSGTEAYQGLVLPLRSAVEHFRLTAKPPSTAAYFDAYLVIGLAVLDAPMLTSHRGLSGSQLDYTPWQRLWRHEPLSSDAFRSQFGESSAIDIVHKGYLSTYVEQHLLPFAEAFAVAVQNHEAEVASGKGFVSGMGSGEGRTGIEARLRRRR